MHLIKYDVKRIITTKCGIVLSRKQRDEATVWQSQVDCPGCLGISAKEISFAPLLPQQGLLYNKGIKQAQIAPHNQGGSVMARNTSTTEEQTTDEAVVVEEKPAKKAKRPDTPEGYVTPVKFAHELSAKLSGDSFTAGLNF